MHPKNAFVFLSDRSIVYLLSRNENKYISLLLLQKFKSKKISVDPFVQLFGKLKLAN